MKMNKKGFTLIEMLVVIAIIAVLVSIVIPTVTSATEKAKEAADVANIRSAVATVTTEVLANGDTSKTVVVNMSQAKNGFQSTDISTIGGIDDAGLAIIKNATKGQTITIGWASDKISVTLGGKAVDASQPTVS